MLTYPRGMTMMSILASLVCSLPLATAQPDANALRQPEMPRQQQNATPGPIAELPAGTPEPAVFGEFGKRRITGITANRFGRVFVCSPAPAGESGAWVVAERKEDGTLVPYPPGDPAAAQPLVLTAVTSIQVDAQERLWILDSANPDGKGVVRAPGPPGWGAGPKLVCIELSTNTVAGVWPFNDRIAPATSMLADVRLESNDRRQMLRDSTGRETAVDPQIERHDTNWAYITDAGGGDAGGALLVINMNAAKVRRLLAGYECTKADPGFVANVRGAELKVGGGGVGAAPMALNADAIAIDTVNEVIYWQPLGSRTLYSLRTAFIRDTGLKNEDLAKRVNNLGPTVMASSMLLDAAGVLYFSAVERDAVIMRAPNGSLSTFVQAPGLSWIDGMTFTRDPVTKRGAVWMPATRAYGAAPAAADEGFKVWQAVLTK